MFSYPIRGSAILLAALPGLILAQSSLRPPAVPLVTHDPYLSVWSMGDELHGSPTQHWTGERQNLSSMIRIDGRVFRLIGTDPRFLLDQPETPLLQQTGREVWPTRTVYTFTGQGVEARVEFLSPMIASDLELVGRPVTYLTWTVRSTDGRAHQIDLHFEASSELARNDSTQAMTWGRLALDDMTVLRTGTREQNLLGRQGDALRIDWGYLHLLAPEGDPQHAIADRRDLLASFTAAGKLPAADDLEPDVVALRSEVNALAVAWDLGRISSQPVSRHALLAYDDIYSLEFMNERLRPYWRRERGTLATMLRAAVRNYADLRARAEQFDRELMVDLERTGGREYAEIAALAYRQTLAAHKLAITMGGKPLFLSKENHSNGSIGTVDVTYPSAPFFLLLNPDLLEAMIRPIFDYARLPVWKFPYAPHDLGQYPLANGQQYGGGETSETRQMPVEESANMILMAAGIARAEGDTHFAEEHMDLLTQWAEYLREKGFDPEAQLSTDDFTGHLAHNTNLSLKAILALGAYAQLCEQIGCTEAAQDYRAIAEDFASRWPREADDGDHYRLAFDRPGTWSQKYNLVWDRLLGLDLFAQTIAEKEVAYYLRTQNQYGLPLDNRSQFTKLDWIFWSATLAADEDDFRALVSPVWRFLNETPDRSPMTDWYWTHDARRRGFTARSVVGGVYIKMLHDPAIWRKWASRAQ